VESVPDLGKYIGLTVSIFAIVGIGIGLTGFFPMEYIVNQFSATDGGQFAQAISQLFIGVIFLQSIIIVMLTGPTIGGLTGIMSGLSLGDRVSATIVGGIGSFIGFYIMVIVSMLVMSVALPSTTGGGGETGVQQSTDLSQIIIPIIKSGLPTGIVGAITGALGGSYLS
jgi:hypothetical protein